MATLCTHYPWKQRMAHDHEYTDDYEDEEEEEEAIAPRSLGPRFGPFVTIAVAILLLFGAASRIGKPAETGGLLGIDLLASQSLDNERLRLQEQRNTTLVTLGALPAPPEELRPPPRSVRIENQVLPPPRGDVSYLEYEERRRPPAPLSLPVPTDDAGSLRPDAGATAPGSSQFDPAPEAPQRPAPPAGGTYVVATGDNWVKIGKATGRKWQDIQRANPQASEGLRVGMRLTIP